MSFFDDVGKFGSGVLDSVGEGFDNLVTNITTGEQQSMNSGTTPQTVKQADDHGNKVTPNHDSNDKTLLYVGGGVAALLVIGGLIIVAKR